MIATIQFLRVLYSQTSQAEVYTMGIYVCMYRKWRFRSPKVQSFHKSIWIQEERVEEELRKQATA